ncbi:cell morphogenesis protein-like protein Sog2 [Bimuria novae-zelandiae CBS 107.79]|uniref:Cell morphogenesis protein-like protein Sog2 n=1 Tax=Bimuria novae-zelandiae CBS 107.79 TaxID=1447943 RepID=A0A6A5V720_9PLEO|nr:cell morphogenesis protein-like protein Sog2 [Bimuria novae-zelandiae CBS 107.79]
MSNDTPTPISDDEVVALAKAAFEQSRDDINHRAAETPNAAQNLQSQQPGITIDLGHKNIARLPDEVIDVIRAEIERLALSHNLLSTLPSRLIECKRLRYLNVRYNAMREIPEAILEMTSLEILDVSRNKLRSIPSKIVNLASLKVLAIAKNRIEELPVCLGEMNSLQVLKLDGNQLVFPPPEVCTIRSNAPSPANENERDAHIATQVKKFMRQHASKEKQRVETDRLRVESSGDESWTESNPETPRPSRRINGGRFPVKPSMGNIEGFPENRSDSPGMAPPIPTRSHYRVASQSQTNGISRRPQIPPLILTNGSNERNRSASEGAGPGSGSSTQRQKRMGIYTKQTPELGSVDELKRTSHFRGFSQGYLVPANNLANGMSGPATAIGYGDSGTMRPLANRPLSDVYENKRGSQTPDIVVEASKNFLFAVSQLHDCLAHMVRSIKRTARSKDETRRKEDFYRRHNSTYLNVRALNDLLHRYEALAEEDEEDTQKISESIYQYALSCLDSFLTVSLSIAENRVEITRYADARIVRTFLFLQQGSLVEMRNACQILGAEFRDIAAASRPRSNPKNMGTLRPRPLKTRRFQQSPPQRNGSYQMPPPVILHSNENSRTNTLTSISSATPRSGESFNTATTMSRSNTLTSTYEDADEDNRFARIFDKLKAACENCDSSIPQIIDRLTHTHQQLARELDSEDPRLKVLGSLIEKSHHVQTTSSPLSYSLRHMQFGDHHVRNQPDFWQKCMTLIKAWGDLAAASTAQGRNMRLLSPEVKQLMKPLHKTIKDASLAINDSPWSHLTSNNPGIISSLSSFTSKTQPPRFLSKSTMSSGSGLALPGPINTSITNLTSAYAQPYSTTTIGSQGSGGYATPVPATPLSAALGAAAQATIPNTPNHPPHLSTSTINFNERADRFLSQTARRI